MSSRAYPGVLLQHARDRLFGTSLFYRVRGMRILITPQLVADVLHVPRIEFPDYPNCEHLKTVSRDELMSSFCERPTAWDERLLHHVDLLLKVLDS